MKLCMIFPHYPPNYRIGGIEDYTQILVEKFRKMGIDTYIIASSRYTGDDDKVFKIGDIEWGYDLLKTVVDIVNDNKFDIVIMQYTPESYGFGFIFKLLPLYLKFLRKPPFFITTFHTLVGGKWISKIYAFMLTIFSNKVISTNDELTYLFKKYLGVFNSKLRQIPIGSNINHLGIDRTKARRDVSQEMNIIEGAVWLSNFGFTIPNKGVDDLFEALAKLIEDSEETYYLFMISSIRDCDYQYRAELIELSKKLKVDKYILWITEPSDAEVSKYLTVSDIFVVPYKDGICTRRGTLMAGIVHHLPIVSTYSRVYTPYFKNEENVLLVDAGNSVQLAQAIDKLSKNEKLKEKLSLNIAKIEKYFNWDQIAYNIIALYGMSSKKFIEKMRYPVKIIFESLEYVFLKCLFLKIKKTSKNIPDISQINPTKILVVQLNSIGDVLMTTPALKSLKKRFPLSKIDVLTLPHTSILLKENSNVNKVFCCDKNFWRLFPLDLLKFNENRKNLKIIKQQNYDLCIDFNATFESAVLSVLLVKKLRLGIAGETKKGIFREKTSSYYSVSVTPEEKHIIGNNLLLMKKLGVQDVDWTEEFFISDENKKYAHEFKKEYGVEDEHYVVIHPSSKWPPKRWPAVYFGKLIDMLNDRMNLRTVLVGSVDDNDLLESITRIANAKPIMCCSNLNLPSLGELIKVSKIFIGNDSGISHIAASVGAKTVVLFGPTDPDMCLPQGSNVTFIRNNMSCWPCVLYYRRSNCELGDNVCMNSIDPNEVMDKVKNLCA